MSEFNAKVALQTFVLRYLENSSKEKINNASLYAGSPMYFYCKACTCHVATLPESYITPPPKYCDSCRPIVNHGLLDLGVRLAKEIKNRIGSENFTLEQIFEEVQKCLTER